MSSSRISCELDSYALSAVLVSAALPLGVSKFVIAIAFFVLTAVALGRHKAVAISHWSILVTILLFPSFIFALNSDPFQLARLLPILFIAIFSPFLCLKASPGLVYRLSIAVVLYLVAWQALILIGAPGALFLRDALYPYHEVVHPFVCDPLIGPQYCSAETLWFSFAKYRAAGIYFNPNQLSLILLILYSAIYTSWMALRNCSLKRAHSFLIENWIISLVVIYAQFLTGSRAGMIAMACFYLALLAPCIYLNFGKLLQHGVALNKWTTFVSTALGGFVLYVSIPPIARHIALGFMPGDSVDYKFSTLRSYASDLSFLSILVGHGSVSGVHFDFEYGYFFAFGGLIALVAIILFYVSLVFQKITLLPVVIALFVSGFSNSVLYSLLTSFLLIPVIASAFLKVKAPAKLSSLLK